jgi:hypothetical protein
MLTHKLHLLEYEAEPDREEYPDPQEERVLDDADVARLLAVDSGLSQRGREEERVLTDESAGDTDALSTMRGVMIGLVLVASFWVVVAAVYLLA